ncbi:MAG: DUF1778 domain-containing protein [Aminipila sp.]
MAEKKTERKNSESRLAANRRYDDKAYDKIMIRVKAGQKERIQQAADNEDKSLNGYIVEAITEKMERGNL